MLSAVLILVSEGWSMAFCALSSVASRDEAATGDGVRRSECLDVAAVKYSECCSLFGYLYSSAPPACVCVVCARLHHLTTTAPLIKHGI